MGFDQQDSRQIIKPAKRTTKVNISIVVGVIVFFAVGAAAIAWLRANHNW